MTARAYAPSRVVIWCVFGVCYVVLALAYAWPLLGRLATALPNDAGDPALNAWILWWNGRALPFTDAWWNAPVFFPGTGALAYSETLLSFTPLTTPLQWLGFGPVAAYNVAFLVSFPLSALAAHALARHVTGRHAAGLLAGLAFGFSPYRAAQLPHIQLLWAFWMPLCLLALHRYVSKYRAVDLAAAGACWMLNGLTCGYYLVFFAVLVVCWMCWFLRERREWLRVTLAFAVASVPLMPVLIGYQRHLGAIGATRVRVEIEAFSADLTAIWSASPLAWLPSHWTFTPRPEGELYPGLLVFALVVVGVVMAWRRLEPPLRPEPKKGVLFVGVVALTAALIVWLTGGASGALFGMSFSVTRPHRLVGIGIALVVIALLFDRRIRGTWRRRSTFGFYVAAAGVMFAFALGPVGHAFGARFMDKAPYFWLMRLPGGGSLRDPARFAMLFMLCVSQAAAIAFIRIRPAPSPMLMFVVAVLVVADGWIPRLPTAAVPAAITLDTIDRSAVVLELPIRDLYDDTAAMLRATGHGRPVINGFSGYIPPHYTAVTSGLREGDRSILDALGVHAPIAVVVNRERDDDGKASAFVKGSPHAIFAFDSATGPVYVFDRTPPRTHRKGDELRLVAVEASDRTESVSMMTDGNLDTRWDAARAQSGSSEVRITLDRPTDLVRIEMDLAGAAWAYPRQCRVSASPDDGPLRLVWEGGTAGAAFEAAVIDPKRTTLVLDLPASTIGRRITIASTGTTEEPWSIAELRVFGSAVADAR